MLRPPIFTASASGRRRVPAHAVQVRGSASSRPCAPNPSQDGQAPKRWPKLNRRGSGAGSPAPHRGHARLVEYSRSAPPETAISIPAPSSSARATPARTRSSAAPRARTVSTTASMSWRR
jgi:hypothetical protein